MEYRTTASLQCQEFPDGRGESFPSCDHSRKIVVVQTVDVAMKSKQEKQVNSDESEKDYESEKDHGSEYEDVPLLEGAA